MDLPSPLTRRMGRIVEVLIRRFQKSEVKSIHGFFRNQVGAKEYAVRKPEKKIARGIWLSPQLRDACADVQHDIRIVLQELPRATQVFSAFGYMSCDKCSLWMARHDSIALIKQLSLGKMRPIKTPVGVRCQFLIAL